MRDEPGRGEPAVPGALHDHEDHRHEEEKGADYARDVQLRTPGRAPWRAQRGPKQREPGPDHDSGRAHDPDEHQVRKVGALHGFMRASMYFRASAKLICAIEAS